MQIDYYVKSQELLERLANSIHDRDPKAAIPFFFSTTELQSAQKWLQEFVKEVKSDCYCK